MDLQKAEILAIDLLKKHNLKNWNFYFDKAKKRFGCCNYTDKKISLSRFLVELNTEEQVKDVILHEIAHALVGPKNNHNHLWKKKVKEIGGSPSVKFCNNEVKLPKMKYTAKCKNCNLTFQAAKINPQVACRHCCKKFNNGKYSKKFTFVFFQND